MLYFHKELKEKLKSDYQIQKAVFNKRYYKIKNGLYSDVKFVNPLEIICNIIDYFKSFVTIQS